MLDLIIEQATALKGHIEMLNALFKHATEGIIVVDATGEIAMVNPKALRLFGYDEEAELIGNKIEVVIPRRFSGKHHHHRSGYMDSPHARSMGGGLNLTALKRDGSEFPVEISLSPFETSEGRFVVSFIIDITERKRHEKAIIEANEEIVKLNTVLEARVEQRTNELAMALEQINKSKQEVMRALEKERELNDMKSKFVTIASHEFRTPLATVLSSVSLIGRYTGGEDDDKRQKHVKRIKSSINNLTEILNDFLSLGKLEEGLVKSIPIRLDIKKFCTELTEDLKAVCKPGQFITYEHSGQEIGALDSQLVRNVIINMVSNAIKYSEKEIIVKSTTTVDTFKLSIQDFGIGIPEEDLPHLFGRFFRAANSGNVQGTGLGLNIVKKYLELMNGTITVESTMGYGTTFEIEIPLSNL